VELDTKHGPGFGTGTGTELLWMDGLFFLFNGNRKTVKKTSQLFLHNILLWFD
jgi:hypothetical protein